jgi:Fe-S cluster biosynthesis and repair protein YggX
MTRMVYCKKYQKELEGLERPPFPGPAGQAVFETVSKAAWQAWLSHQTLLINEKHLKLMEPETQAYLAEQRALFLNNEEVDHAEGFVSPTEKKE